MLDAFYLYVEDTDPTTSFLQDYPVADLYYQRQIQRQYHLKLREEEVTRLKLELKSLSPSPIKATYIKSARRAAAAGQEKSNSPVRHLST